MIRDDITNIKNSDERLKASVSNKLFDKIKINTSQDKKAEKEEKKCKEDLIDKIRKYKKASRRINKMKKLFKDIKEEYDYCYQQAESGKFCYNLFCCFCKKDARYGLFQFFKYILLLIIFVIVIFIDILIPLAIFDSSNKTNVTNITNITDLISDTVIISENLLTDTVSNDTLTSTDNDNIFEIILYLILYLLIIIVILVFTSYYTIIVLFTINRRRYISGDFLSGKKRNGSISLMKTIKEIYNYLIPLVYCNYYFLTFISKANFIFYEIIYIPDYELVHGFGLFMLSKMLIITISICIYAYFGGLSIFFKNDLADFIKKIDEKKNNVVEDEKIFNQFIENNKIYKIVSS